MDSGYPAVQGREYRAEKGAVSLFLWRKTCSSAHPADPSPPVVLVHGSSMSSLPTFDLEVSGHPDYSFMDWLARHGCDVWTLDHEGYGHSTITESNSDVGCGVEDLKVAFDVVARETGAEVVDVYGLSSGALRAAGFAQAAPDRVRRLTLDAFVWTGQGSPTLTKRRDGVEYFRTHNRRPIDRDFITSIFTRDLPGTSDPAVIEACAQAQLAYADSVPTGTYLDMTTKLPLVDPESVACPTLIIRGEHDGIATIEDLLEFFKRLPAGDKRLVVLPNLAHCTPLGLHRHLLFETVLQFFRAG
ncbi:alpha/beta fold hydrolase (plasmid) [Skermanella mucosa]|uniref:alpha/beta hydrolase n=1 Tax=Skermanella mucosa TaxID=1789672 RepID=UPI00192AA114|nr:alpha/beta fold hydrolase [Skermanella mucosa]UEM24434.1 alpha/beta fold hydrolase [Skermanella mucosa]